MDPCHLTTSDVVTRISSGLPVNRPHSANEWPEPRFSGNDAIWPKWRRAARPWAWSEPRCGYESARSYQRSTRRARKVFHRLGRPSLSSVSTGITPG